MKAILLLLFVSCTILHHNEGEYGLLLLHQSEKNKKQTYYVYKDSNSSMMGYGCGASANLELATKAAIKKYNAISAFNAVGIADAKVSSYLQGFGIVFIPCLQIEGTPVVAAPLP